MARYYGMLIDGLEMAYVNGFAYNTITPRRRRSFRRASSAWTRSSKASSGGSSFASGTRRASRLRLQRIASSRRLIRAHFSDAELVAYPTWCRDHHAAMMFQHFRFTGAAVVPTGDFLAHVEDWTGLPRAELLGLMRGSASVSAGGSAELERLVAAVGQDASALELLESEDRPRPRAHGVALARG